MFNSKLDTNFSARVNALDKRKKIFIFVCYKTRLHKRFKWSILRVEVEHMLATIDCIYH